MRKQLLILLAICGLAATVASQGIKIAGPTKVAGPSNVGGKLGHIVFSDNFNRPDNTSFGANWGTPFVVPANGTSGGIQLLSNAFTSLSTHSGQVQITTARGGPFANDQWAEATIAAIAPSTSVVAITAASQSGSNTTYTYTLSSGSALIMGQQIYVTGMAHAGNNSTVGFNVTGLGAGTFTVVNASGVTATENGTGTSPSDSFVGLIVRGSADGKTGYYCLVGTNSGMVGGSGVSTDQRVYEVELWKSVSGVQTFLASSGVVTSITDQVGDFYALSAVGTKVTLYHNGVRVLTATDSSIASGSPGMIASSISGASEWENPTGWTDVGATGNSGTRWSNWVGGDSSTKSVPYLDNFIGTNGTDISAYNSHWVENNGTFQISSNAVDYTTLVSGNAMMSWQGSAFNNDQWAQTTISLFSANGNKGVAVRVDPIQNTGYMYRQNLSNTRVLYRIVSNTFTNLATSNTAHNNTFNDKLRLVVIGSKLYCFLNGTLENFGVITDATPITSGYPGIQGAANVDTQLGTLAVPFQAGNAGIGGNAGISGATLTLSGAGSGTTTSDVNGNYLFGSGIVDGTYTVTPSLAGHTFSPSSLTVVVAGASLFPIGENFSVQ